MKPKSLPAKLHPTLHPRAVQPLPLLIATLGAYLAGSIPFGLVLTKLAGYGDIRKIALDPVTGRADFEVLR